MLGYCKKLVFLEVTRSCLNPQASKKHYNDEQIQRFHKETLATDFPHLSAIHLHTAHNLLHAQREEHDT